MNRKALISSPDQRTALEAWAEEAPDGPALARKVQQEGVSFILVNGGERVRTKHTPQVSRAGLRVLDAFWKRYTAREFGVLDPKDRWVGVYTVLDDVQASKPHIVDDLFGQDLKKSGP